jgi:hypothetical protein
MSLILDGTNGLSDVDGSASTPAIRGTDTNTGIFFPAADTIAFAEGGVEVMRISSAGCVGIGNTNPIGLGQLEIQAPSTGAALWVQTGGTTSAFTIAEFRTGTNASALALLGDGTMQNQGLAMFACRAWVNFTGTGTVTIRASGNVSSITDNGTGAYSVNFSTAMPDVNYSVNSTSGWPQDANASMNYWSNQTTSQTKLWARNQASNIAEDPPSVTVAIFR